jgi:aspartate/methionine/tyrosine aminotransferase
MRHSTRLPDNYFPNPLTRRLRKLNSASAPILDLTVSNPAECGIDYPRDDILAAISNSQVFSYKPDPRGLECARAAIAKMHGHYLGPENIQLTASTSEAYSMLFKLLANPGDNIIVPSPSYPLFEWLARLEGLACVTVPTLWCDDWRLDIDALDGVCDANTKAIVVVNPNNPTGQFITESEWFGLLELATEKNLPLIVDEVFAPYPIECQSEALRTILDVSAPECSVFLLSGLSKLALLPQLKLGWIVMLGPASAAAEPLAFIADQYLSVSAITAYAAPQLLAIAPQLQSQVISRLKKNLDALDEALKERPHLSRRPVYGGWSVLIQRPDIEDDESCALRLLSDFHLLIYPGHFFDIPKNGFLVASLLPEPGVFEKAIRILTEAI